MPLASFRRFLAIAAVAALAVGCGDEESTPEAQGAADGQPSAEAVRPGVPLRGPRGPNTIVEKMDPDGKGMHLTATTPTGKTFEASIGEQVEIPEAFPDDVPVFPGAKPMASMSSPDEGVIVTFKSTEEQQKIFDFYESSLAEAGWELLEDSSFGGPLSIEALKDSRKVSVIVAGTKGDARVSVIVSPQS